MKVRAELPDPRHRDRPETHRPPARPDDLDTDEWPSDDREYESADDWPDWTDRVIPYGIPGLDSPEPPGTDSDGHLAHYRYA